MKKPSQDEILSSSAAWVAIVLNLLPGLGTGYIYQRRWNAYWSTIISSTIWIFIGVYRDLALDPSDPATNQEGLFGFLGLLFIALFTSIEAGYKIKVKKDFIHKNN